MAHGMNVFVDGYWLRLSHIKNLIAGSLRDANALESVMTRVLPDAVIHLAGVAFVGHDNAEDFYQVNLFGTRKLLIALQRCAKIPECVVVASSANVYGNQASGLIDEQAQPAPANDYGVSKLAMEYLVRSWQDRLPLVIVRPFNYTGIGQSEQFVIPKIVTHFRQKRARIELGNLDIYRDFGDVRAVAFAYRRLIECSPVAETFNIATGVAVSLAEVLSQCENLSGHSMVVEVNPAYVRSHEVSTLCGDVSRLSALIGDWNPPLLTETLEWMFKA